MQDFQLFIMEICNHSTKVEINNKCKETPKKPQKGKQTKKFYNVVEKVEF